MSYNLYKGNKIYLGLNVNDDSIKTIYDSSKLSEYNNRGYNIYESINTFISNKRTKTKVYEFLGIGIDLDENISFNKLEKRISKLNGILPTKINKTYKGYHLFFEFSPELYFLSISNYEILWNKINEILKGDILMKNVTGILKIENFIDHKKGRNFLIKNIFNKNNFINKNLLQFFIKSENLPIQRIGFRKDVLKDKENNKALRKDRNESLLEKVCALDLIRVINKNVELKREGYDKKIELINKTSKNISIKGYSGLKLFYNINKGIREIKDHTVVNKKEKRYGILFFLQNFYFKNNPNKFKLINLLLSKNYGIILNKKNGDVPISEQLSLAFIQKDIKIELTTTFKEEYNDMVEFNNDLVKEYGNSSIKLFIGLINFLNEKNNFKVISDENFTFRAKDFLEYMGISYGSYNIHLMRKMFLILSSVKVPEIEVKEIEGKKRQFIKYQHFMVFSETSKGEGIRYYDISFNIPNFSKVIYLRKGLEKLDKGLGKGNNTMLGFKINIALSKYPSYYITNKEIGEILNFSENRMKNRKDFNREIKKISEALLKNEIIKDFKIKEKGIYFYKNKVDFSKKTNN